MAGVHANSGWNYTGMLHTNVLYGELGVQRHMQLLDLYTRMAFATIEAPTRAVTRVALISGLKRLYEMSTRR